MEASEFRGAVSGIAALEHPTSEAVYRFVADRGNWIGRDETADGLSLARSVAAFHLDKLVEAGLLEVRFERISGRQGPGAGRPAKLYRRAPIGIEVSVPERRYALAGSLLADAVERATLQGGDVRDALAESAHEQGSRVGADARSMTRRPSRAARRAAMIELLEREGYEPTVVGDEIALRNYPFHTLAQQHRGLVCGMNRDFLDGVIDGLDAHDTFNARLAPAEGYCCVRVDVR